MSGYRTCRVAGVRPSCALACPSYRREPAISTLGSPDHMRNRGSRAETGCPRAGRIEVVVTPSSTRVGATPGYGTHSSASRGVRSDLGYRNTGGLSNLPQTTRKRVQHRRYDTCSSRVPIMRTKRPIVMTNRERGPLPGLLTVDYFTTSPGGILAPHTRVSNVSRKTRVRRQATQQHTR